MPCASKYKAIFNLSFVDKESRLVQNQRFIFLLQQQEYILQLSQALSSNVDKKELTEFGIKEIEARLSRVSSYMNSHNASISFEQGIIDRHSLGFMLHNMYYRERFQFLGHSYDASSFSEYASKSSIAGFHKYQMLETQNVVLSLQTKFILEQSLYKKLIYGEPAMLFGWSKNYVKPYDRPGNRPYNKNKFSSWFTRKSTFLDLGFSCSHCFDNNVQRYGLSISNGVELNNGLILSNYVKFSIDNSKNKRYVYHSTLYSQISIAKTINHRYLSENKLTVQIGYYVDRSLVYRRYGVSGIGMSLWISN